MTITSGTLTVSNILTRDLSFQYVTDGFNNDLTTSSITITFDSTQTISRIAMMGMNLKEFNLFYDGVTANAFSFTTTAATTTSQFSTNSETSMYFKCSTIQSNSITLDMKATQAANAEKAIGLLYLGNLKLDFETTGRNPSADGYNPNYKQKQVVHKMSDGGSRLQTIDEKFNCKLNYKHIDTTFRNALRTVFDTRDSFQFVPFGTSTSWDLIFHHVVWTGGFNFFKYSDNAIQAGFSGDILLKEVTE